MSRALPPRQVAELEWKAALRAVESAQFNTLTLDRFMQGAALIKRVAELHPSSDARAVERWLSTIGVTVALVRAHVRGQS